MLRDAVVSSVRRGLGTAEHKAVRKLIGPSILTHPANGSAHRRAFVMRATDLTIERDKRAHRRFALTVRHVQMAATPEQSRLLGLVLDAVEDGSMKVTDAHAALRALQRQQQAA